MSEYSKDWPRDADDLVNGIPETVKAAKSMGHVPASGNDPEAQLRAAKHLTAAGIEVPEGIQSTAITPADRRAAVERQNEYAAKAAGELEQAEGWNPVKHAAAVERGEDPADAAREDAKSAAEKRQTAAGDSKESRQQQPAGRSAERKSQT